MDFRGTSLLELSARVQAREVSARELVGHALAQIERHDGAINAFVAVDGDRALADADLIDRRIAAGAEVGPLAGIPIGVKDLEDAAGFVTTYGSALHVDDAPAQADATVVARLRTAGCVVLGKTNTPEHGWTSDTTSPAFGATRNPIDLERSAGGSSGGSAAALAAGMVPLATGSDGGGSIRIPSALCGLPGFMPSHGRVPNGGTTRGPGSGVMGVKGPMAGRMRDVAYALDVVLGPDPLDPYSVPTHDAPWFPDVAGYVAPPRRVLWSTMGYDVDTEVRSICDAALRRIEGAGVEVVPVEQVLTDDPVWTFLQLWSVYRARAQGHLRDTPDWERIDPGLRGQIDFAAHVDAPAFASALDACYRYNAEFEACFDAHGADLLLTPTVAGQTGLVGRPGTIDGEERLDWVRYTYPCNLTRRPAGTVPAGRTADGMPVGLQVVGRRLDDRTVLRALTAIEDVLG